MKNDKLAIKTFTKESSRIDEHVNGWLRDELDIGNIDLVSMKYLDPFIGVSGRIYNTVVIEYKY